MDNPIVSTKNGKSKLNFPPNFWALFMVLIRLESEIDEMQILLVRTVKGTTSIMKALGVLKNIHSGGDEDIQLRWPGGSKILRDLSTKFESMEDDYKHMETREAFSNFCESNINAAMHMNQTKTGMEILTEMKNQFAYWNKIRGKGSDESPGLNRTTHNWIQNCWVWIKGMDEMIKLLRDGWQSTSLGERNLVGGVQSQLPRPDFPGQYAGGPQLMFQNHQQHPPWQPPAGHHPQQIEGTNIQQPFFPHGANQVCLGDVRQMQRLMAPEHFEHHYQHQQLGSAMQQFGGPTHGSFLHAPHAGTVQQTIHYHVYGGNYPPQHQQPLTNHQYPNYPLHHQQPFPDHQYPFQQPMPGWTERINHVGVHGQCQIQQAQQKQIGGLMNEARGNGALDWILPEHRDKGDQHPSPVREDESRADSLGQGNGAQNGILPETQNNGGRNPSQVEDDGSKTDSLFTKSSEGSSSFSEWGGASFSEWDSTPEIGVTCPQNGEKRARTMGGTEDLPLPNNKKDGPTGPMQLSKVGGQLHDPMPVYPAMMEPEAFPPREDEARTSLPSPKLPENCPVADWSYYGEDPAGKIVIVDFSKTPEGTEMPKEAERYLLKLMQRHDICVICKKVTNVDFQDVYNSFCSEYSMADSEDYDIIKVFQRKEPAEDGRPVWNETAKPVLAKAVDFVNFSESLAKTGEGAMEYRFDGKKTKKKLDSKNAAIYMLDIDMARMNKLSEKFVGGFRLKKLLPGQPWCMTREVSHA